MRSRPSSPSGFTSAAPIILARTMITCKFCSPVGLFVYVDEFSILKSIHSLCLIISPSLSSLACYPKKKIFSLASFLYLPTFNFYRKLMKGQVDLFAAKGMPTSLTTAPVPFQRLVKHLSQYKGRTEELKVRHYYLCVSLCDLSHPSPFVSQLVLAYFTFRIFLYSFVF